MSSFKSNTLGLIRRPHSQSNRSRASRRSEFRRKPRIESLERRALLAASIFEVTNTDDSGAGSLRNAIEAANACPGEDVIRFARSVSGVIELDPGNGTLNITDDLVILGPGVDRLSISGSDAVRVFAVLPAALADDPFTTPTMAQLDTSPEVTISRLTISNGLASTTPGFDPSAPSNPGFAFGGGLFNAGGTVQLNRVQMTGNTAANAIAAGGAVANEFGGTMTVSRSHFENNAATGFLVGVGGAITSDLGPTAGGATTGQPSVEIHRSSFVSNRAVASVGSIEDVAFSGLGGGGAILSVTGAMSITQSEFVDNTAIGGTGTGNSISGGPGMGGAILSGDASPFGVAESTLEIERSRFTGNSAVGGAGGTADLPGGQARGGAVAVVNDGEAMLTRNLFQENASFGGAGGENADGGIASGGGVSAVGGSTLALERNSFIQNSAEGGDGSGSGSAATGRGGGLAIDEFVGDGFLPGSGSAMIVGDSYHQNEALGGIGGGIFNEGELTAHRTTLSENAAIGKADVLMADVVPGYVFQGGSLGGGMSNIGTAELEGVTFESNVAIGADGATGPNIFTMTPGTAVSTYPGLAVGGGLHTVSEATVSRSRFVGNEALAGDNNSGTFAGVSNGGGIYNDANLTISRSSLSGNRAVGGDNNEGDINAGGAYGGAISSGTVTFLFGVRSASLVVEQTKVEGNESLGGSGNSEIFQVPPAHAPNVGFGGGINVYQGSAEISQTQIRDNLAAGGDGGFGVGGGVFFFSFVGPVNSELSNSLVVGNRAIGGEGASGYGGGIAAGSLGSIFGGDAEVSIERSLVFGNLAEGGDAGAASSGGDGLGGGIYNHDDADLVLQRSRVFRNRAVGSDGGVGIGGGLHNLGDVELIRARIFANFASTSDDDCFGC